MGKPKIDRVLLDKMLREGQSPKEAAKFFGVSEVAIWKARKQLNIAVIKSVAL